MFKGYLSHRGRVGRLHMVGLNLLNILALVLLSSIIYFVYEQTQSDVVLVFFLACLPIAYSNLVVSIKRLHDLNLSGWWILWFALIELALSLIDQSSVLSSIASFAQLVLYVFIAGTDGPNRFGPKPGVPEVIPPSGDDDQNAPSFGAPA
jgi:uncharacterized membrane protein YhaH (DUF805 family)